MKNERFGVVEVGRSFAAGWRLSSDVKSVFAVADSRSGGFTGEWSTKREKAQALAAKKNRGNR